MDRGAWRAAVHAVTKGQTQLSDQTALCVPSRFGRVRLPVIPWTAARQAALSMVFSRYEHWSGLSWPPGDLPDSGIEPTSLTSPALAGGFFTTCITWEAQTATTGI